MFASVWLDLSKSKRILIYATSSISDYKVENRTEKSAKLKAFAVGSFHNHFTLATEQETKKKYVQAIDGIRKVQVNHVLLKSTLNLHFRVLSLSIYTVQGDSISEKMLALMMRRLESASHYWSTVIKVCLCQIWPHRRA